LQLKYTTILRSQFEFLERSAFFGLDRNLGLDRNRTSLAKVLHGTESRLTVI
jgi:hypothetical protein